MHRTEAGGIRTDIGNEQDFGRPIDEITKAARAYHPDAEIRGLTLQPMVQKADVSC